MYIYIYIYIGDEDEIKNELIGLVYEKLTAVLKATNNTLETKWYNLYGKPEDKNENLVSSPLLLHHKYHIHMHTNMSYIYSSFVYVYTGRKRSQGSEDD